MSNKYKCDNCKIETDWEQSDINNGSIWTCEKCDNYICSSCIEKRDYYKGISNLDLIVCNECINK